MRRIPASTLIFAFVSSACAPTRPNFVVIDIDSMRADTLADLSGLPALTELIGRATVHPQSFAQSSWTSPGLASLLSGRYPTVRMDGPPKVVFRSPTFPEILAANGYTTAGSWGATLPSNDPDILARFAQNLVAPPGAPTSPAVAWLEAGPPEPFLLYLHEIDLAQTPSETPESAFHGPDSPNHAPEPQLTLLYEALRKTVGAEAAAADVRAHYVGALRWYDARIGDVLRALDARRLTDNTVVVLISEHGEELLEHGQIAHHGVHYDEVLRVPFVIADPLARGGTSDRLVQSIDLAPTLLRRAGIPLPADLDGHPIDDPDHASTEVFSWSSAEAMSLRTPRWKVALHPWSCAPQAAAYPTCAELYDVTADPAERTNRSEQETAVVHEAAPRLAAWGRERLDQQAGAPVDPKLRDALRERGYWSPE